MPYYATQDQNGTEDEITLYAPDGRRMLSIAFWDDEGPDEDGNPDPLKAGADQLKADAELIVNALNAYQPGSLFEAVKEIVTVHDNMLNINQNVIAKSEPAF